MNLHAVRIPIAITIVILASALAMPQQVAKLTVCVQGGADYLVVHSEDFVVVTRLREGCSSIYLPPGVYRVLALAVRDGNLLISGTKVSLFHDAKVVLALSRPSMCEVPKPIDVVFIGGSPYAIADCDGTPTLIPLHHTQEMGEAVLMGGEKRARPLVPAETGLRVRKRVTPVYIPVLIAILTSVAVYVVVKRAVGG